MLPTLIEASIALTAASSLYELNQAPVIGIVSQPLPEDMKADPRFAGKTTYIMEAYVNFMETAGARVVAIISDEVDTSITDES